MKTFFKWAMLLSFFIPIICIVSLVVLMFVSHTEGTKFTDSEGKGIVYLIIGTLVGGLIFEFCRLVYSHQCDKSS